MGETTVRSNSNLILNTCLIFTLFTAVPDKNRILEIRNRDDFLLKANDVRYQATQLRDLLIENRPAYMRFGYHLKTAIQMSDLERDIIDSESEKIILICSQYIKDLKTNILEKKNSMKTQFVQHKLAILEILTNYLKSIYRIHIEQKENRAKHEMETLRLLKLRTNELVNEQQKQQKAKCLNTTIESRKRVAMDEDRGTGFCDEINIDDLQVLEFENSRVLNDFKGLSDEVEQIEKHVSGIAKLQEIFTEKVYCCYSFNQYTSKSLLKENLIIQGDHSKL